MKSDVAPPERRMFLQGAKEPQCFSFGSMSEQGLEFTPHLTFIEKWSIIEISIDIVEVEQRQQARLYP